MTKNTKNDGTLRDPLKSGDVLVTQKMLEETRNELKSDVTSVKLEVRGLRSDMDAKFAMIQGQMDSKFSTMESQMDSKFATMQSQMDSKFSAMQGQMDSRFATMQGQMDSKFAEMQGQMDAQFAIVGSQFAQLGSLLEANLAKMHRTHALAEAQETRNIAVLEGYDQIYRQQQGLEKRVKKLEDSQPK